jgi:hypothetical protein
MRRSSETAATGAGTIEHSSLEIRLGKVDRIYRPGEHVSGVVVVRAKAGWSHRGVTLRVEGAAKLQLSNRSLGLFESMSTMKPVIAARARARAPRASPPVLHATRAAAVPLRAPLARAQRMLLNQSVEVTGPGRVPDGVTELPFEFALRAPEGGAKLHESYHGVYISVCYTIKGECNRGVMKNALEREIEFIVEVPTSAAPATEERPFNITPESLENVRAASISAIPAFAISGKLHRQACPINMPFTGEVVIESSAAAVRSIELQLVRVESVTHPESGNTAREATEIQNIQIGDGDVCRGCAAAAAAAAARMTSVTFRPSRALSRRLAGWSCRST